MVLKTPFHADTSLKILGYCDASKETIKSYISSGSINRLTALNGEYTLVYTSNGETYIITSLIGAIQYFYYYDGLRFSHGECIIDIINELSLEWEWDWESVGDLCEQENLTNNRTIHRHIRRVTPGTIVTFTDRLKLRTKNLLDGLIVADSDPIGAIKVFNDEVLKWAGENPILSLSGGFDSRVILSSMLKQGINPTVVTLGKKDSSDMQVAEMIVKRFLLDHIRVEVNLDDLLDNGEHIARITNGSKPSCHWHTYLYPKKAQLSKDQSFFVGTLGEFARSYYFDRGFLSLITDIETNLCQEKFWLLKLSRHKTFQQHETNRLCDELRKEIDAEGIKRRAYKNASLAKGDFLSGGTRYYLEQRVPNFYANGIRMYNDTCAWRSPFHNIKWLEIIWSLNDQWKLGSNWHRLAISKNFPTLLEFPEEKGLSRKQMLKKAPPLYWLPMLQRFKYNTYDMSVEWFKEAKTHAFILDNSSIIDDLIERRLIESIIEEHKNSQNRTRAISFLLTILYFKIALKGRVS